MAVLKRSRNPFIAQIKTGSDRALRHATNQIDEVDAYWLKFRFDAPPEGTCLEGVCGRGDSGEPAFIEEQHRFLLADISSWQQIGECPLGTYGCVERNHTVFCVNSMQKCVP